MTSALPSQLVDRFGRRIDYVRLSVTDRCDFRCVYCMAEDMTFVPKARVLSLEELFEVGRSFVELGVSKLRLTGGEPLIRSNILSLIERLGEDRVGLGSDFDGAGVPSPIGSIAGVPALFEALRAHGYGEALLRKIGSENWLRVLEKTWGQ